MNGYQPRTAPSTVGVIDGKRVTLDPTTGDPTVAPTRKVLTGAIVAGALVVVCAAITAITPDLLAGLGPWGIVVYSAIVALGGFLGGYIRRP